MSSCLRVGLSVLVSTLFILPSIALAQYERVAIDTVLAFSPGTKQTSGQGPSFFPKNIFGVPDSRADTIVPVTDPRQVCSIGYGGTITVGFSKHFVVDGPGADFTIFENAFRYSSNRVYAEPAMVEVSTDGVIYSQFPYDAATLRGCAGVTPVFGEADPFDPFKSGGDAFDLATIGVDSIRFIRITDITAIVLENPQHAFYDPTLTGFDLDAVCARHAIRAPLRSGIAVIAGTHSVRVDVSHSESILRVYQINGALIEERTVRTGSFDIELDHMPLGPIILSLVHNGDLITRKVLR